MSPKKHIEHATTYFVCVRGLLLAYALSTLIKTFTPGP